ncbi:MAG: dihydroorotate dehydrogenase [Candidatus Cloacimonadaceae bacterium]
MGNNVMNQKQHAGEQLKTSLGVLKMKTPISVSSGTFDLETLEFYDQNCLGAFVCKTITREPKKGNPPPRLYETEAGLINSIGLQNPGLDMFIKENLPRYREELSVPLIVSFSGSSTDEFCEMLEMLEAQDGIDGYEINISCPNVENEGIAFGTQADVVHTLVSRLKPLTKRELCIKLSPNVTDITEIAKAAEAGGATSLALINSLYGMAIDHQTGMSRIKMGVGGYTGMGIKPVALALTYKTAQVVDIPIVAMGGIYDWKDALEFIWAGASAIALGTAHFVNPLAAPEVMMGLGDYLLNNNKSMNDIKGACRFS